MTGYRCLEFLARSGLSVLSWQRKLTEVSATDASCEVCFLQAVASIARGKELSLSAAVESTDRSLSSPGSLPGVCSV